MNGARGRQRQTGGRAVGGAGRLNGRGERWEMDGESTAEGLGG